MFTASAYGEAYIASMIGKEPSEISNPRKVSVKVIEGLDTLGN